MYKDFNKKNEIIKWKKKDVIISGWWVLKWVNDSEKTEICVTKMIKKWEENDLKKL